MARTVRKLTAVLSTTSDLKGEVSIIMGAVDEINNSLRANEIEIDLLYWTRDVVPGVAQDSQEHINNQLLSGELDIYIGVLGTRIGSPTPRASSGVVEEFRIAYDRISKCDSSVHLLFYFNDAPVKPHSLDIGQFSQVVEFKESLKEKGVVYSMVSSEGELEKTIRMHLTKIVMAARIAEVPDSYGNSRGALTQSSHDRVRSVDSGSEPDDSGVLDYEEEFQENVAIMTQCMGAFSDIMNDLGVQMNEKVNEIDNLTKAQLESTKARKAVVNSTAKVIARYTDQIKGQRIKYDAASDRGMRAFLKYLPFLSTNEGENKDDLSALDEAISFSINAIEGNMENLEHLRTNVSKLPRLTSELNKAKRRFDDEMSLMGEAFAESLRLMTEAHNLIKDML